MATSGGLHEFADSQFPQESLSKSAVVHNYDLVLSAHSSQPSGVIIFVGLLTQLCEDLLALDMLVKGLPH